MEGESSATSAPGSWPSRTAMPYMAPRTAVSSGGITARWLAKQGGRPGDVQFIRDPALKAGACEFQSFLLQFEILARDFQSVLTAPQFDIIPRHLGQQAQHRIVAGLHRSLPFRGGRFECAALAAEKVDFPRGVEAGLINVVFEGEVRRQGQCANERLVLALKLSGIRSGRITCRHKIGRAPFPHGPGLS